jgi:hypothetical protein
MALMMEITMSVQPLWHPSTTADGKFYNGMVVEVIDPINARVHYFAVMNYGPGRSAGFTTGSIVLGAGRGSRPLASKDLDSKINAKIKGGYTDDRSWSPMRLGPFVPPKVRTALENVVAGSAAFQTATPVGTTPPATGMPGAPSQPKPATTRSTPRRKAGALVSNSQVIEKKATAILTMTDTTKALAALRALKAEVQVIRDDLNDAESAFEMATLYVQSRL